MVLRCAYSSGGSYNIGRPGSIYGSPVYSRAIYIQPVAAHAWSTWPTRRRHVINGNGLMRNALNLFTPWAIVITHVCAVVHVVVVYDSSLMDVGVVIVRTSPVVYAIGLIHILRAYEYPPA